jgi:hypothetical protein
MPAEWEPHAATWIGWPHNATDWPGKFPPIPWVYGEIVRALARGEIVRILVNSGIQQAQASRILKKVGVDFARVDFVRAATNRGWTRDFGPIFVRTTGAKPLLAIARDNPPERGGALLGEAMCALEVNEPKRAMQLLEEARPIADTANASQLALLDFTLARAMLATGAPRAKARALAKRALAQLADHPVARHRREIADWLATH